MTRARSVLRNPIIRRIRRHASILTLFRYFTPEIDVHPPREQQAIILPLINETVQEAPPAIAESPDRQQAALPSQPQAQPKASRWRLPEILRQWQAKLTPAKKVSTVQSKATETATSRPPVAPETRVIAPKAETTALEKGTVAPVSRARPLTHLPAPSLEPVEPQVQELPTSTPEHEERPVTEQAAVPAVRAPDTEQAVGVENIPATVPSEPVSSPRRGKPPLIVEYPTPRLAQAVPEMVSGAPPATPKAPVQASNEQPPKVVSKPAPRPVTPRPPIPGRLVAPVVRDTGTTVSVPAPRPPQTASVAPQKQALPGDAAPDDVNWRRLQAIMRKHEEKQTSEKASTPAAQPPEIEQVTSPELPQRTAPVSEAEPTQVFRPEQAAETAQEQNLPLEAVWPVQRVEGKPLSPAKTQPPTPIPSTAPPKTPSISKEEEGVLRQVVQRTETGQPTTSQVEVILPRGPRPKPLDKTLPGAAPQAPQPDQDHEQPVEEAKESTARLSPTRKPEPHAPSSPAPAQQPEPIIQRTQEKVPVEESPQPPEQPAAEETQTPRTERIPISTARSTEETAPSGFVQTEIGPLPVDLWRLLGQSPPRNPVVQPEQPRPTTDTLVQAAPVERKAAPPPARQKLQPDTETPHLVVPAPPEIGASERVSSITQSQPPYSWSGQMNLEQRSESRTVSASQALAEKASLIDIDFAHPPVIQREAATEPTQPGASPATVEPGETGQPAVSLSESELDKLARQVYAEIRQKLAIERERARRRLS